jgi:hypothetical protein
MDDVDAFLQAGIDRLYPGRWETIGGGFGTKIEVGGIGILIVHSDRFIHFAAGLLSGVAYSTDLIRHVSKQNCGSPFGAMTLSEGQLDHWMLAYGLKFVKTWLDPRSRSAPQLVLDVLGFIPQYVSGHVEEMKPKFGGEEWGVGEGWWFVLMDHY